MRNRDNFQALQRAAGFSLVEVMVALLLIVGSVSVSLVVLMSAKVWEKRIRDQQNAMFADFFKHQKQLLDTQSSSIPEAS